MPGDETEDEENLVNQETPGALHENQGPTSVSVEEFWEHVQNKITTGGFKADFAVSCDYKVVNETQYNYKEPPMFNSRWLLLGSYVKSSDGCLSHLEWSTTILAAFMELKILNGM